MVSPCGGQERWCKLVYVLRLKRRQNFRDFRGSQVRQRAKLHDFPRVGTLFNHNGVQGVAGSNPAVPIACKSKVHSELYAVDLYFA